MYLYICAHTSMYAEAILTQAVFTACAKQLTPSAVQAPNHWFGGGHQEQSAHLRMASDCSADDAMMSWLERTIIAPLLAEYADSRSSWVFRRMQ